MCEGTWRCAALIEPEAIRTSRPRRVDSSPMAAKLTSCHHPLHASNRTRHGLYPASHVWAFSSAPGMLVCPRLSAPPRLPAAPPALLLEAAWYIAKIVLTSHSCATRVTLDGSHIPRLAVLLSSLDRNRAFDLQLASVGPTTLVRIPAVQSLLPLDPHPRSLC